MFPAKPITGPGGLYHMVMGHLRVAALLLVFTRTVWSQAPAPTAGGAANNPLLALNIPNLGNLLGNLLGLGNLMGLGNNGNLNQGYGNGLGNVLGLGNILGLFTQQNNMFFNQFLLHSFLGLTITLFTTFALLMGVTMMGGLVMKVLVVTMVLTLTKYGTRDSHHYYRGDRRTINQHTDPWLSKRISPDSTFLWIDREVRT